MKKLVLALAVFLVAGKVSAQDTLYWEDFNNVYFHTYSEDPPSGFGYDSLGYNFDADGETDGSGSSPARPGNWFVGYPFADADSLTPGGLDTNFVFMGNSWFDSPAQALNYLITPSIYISGSNAVLHWKSAPRQTPRYVDGYKVLISTTDNIETSFTDTLFVAAEFLSQADPLPDSTYNSFTFSAGDDVHGQDGNYVEYDGDSLRLLGVLKPFSVSLAQYANQKIFICFLHDSDDDNLISIDDIRLMGDGTVDVNETATDMQVVLFPNPASNVVNVNFNVTQVTPVSLEVYDLAGKQIEKRNLGFRMKGQHTYQFDVAAYTAGNYIVNLRTAEGVKSLNLTVTK